MKKPAVTGLKQAIAIAVIIIAALIQISLIFNNNVWGDEAFTMLKVRESWPLMWTDLINDVHPPLYYLLVKGVLTVVEYHSPLQTAKIVSAAPLMACVIWINALAFRDGLIQTTKDLVTLVCLTLLETCTFNMLSIGQEVRMYSLACFFVTMSGIYAYRYYCSEKRKDATVLAILCVGGMLTHYYDVVLELYIYILLLVAFVLHKRRMIKNWVVLSILTAIGYFWWLPFAYEQFTTPEQYNWSSFTISRIPKYFTYIVSAGKILDFVVILLAIYLVIYVLKCNHTSFNIWAVLCVCSTPFVILFGSAVSILIRPFFAERYMSPSLGLFWLGLAVLVHQYRGPVRKLVSAAAVFMLLIILPINYRARYEREYDPGVQKMMDSIGTEIGSDDILCSDIEHLTWTILDYYFPDHTVVTPEDYSLLDDKTRRVWYFAEQTDAAVPKELVHDRNPVEKVFEGEIDTQYHFIVYRIDH